MSHTVNDYPTVEEREAYRKKAEAAAWEAAQRGLRVTKPKTAMEIAAERVQASAEAWARAEAEAADLPERLRHDLFRKTQQAWGARPGTGDDISQVLADRIGVPAEAAPLDVADSTTRKLAALLGHEIPEPPAA